MVTEQSYNGNAADPIRPGGVKAEWVKRYTAVSGESGISGDIERWQALLDLGADQQGSGKKLMPHRIPVTPGIMISAFSRDKKSRSGCRATLIVELR